MKRSLSRRRKKVSSRMVTKAVTLPTMPPARARSGPAATVSCPSRA